MFLIDDILKGIGQKKQAKEQARGASAQFGQGERSRIWRNQASQALLRTLFGGRYAVPEDTFKNIQTERPYVGADPSKGMGWNMAGDVFGGLGNLALDAFAMKKARGPSTSVRHAPTGDLAAGGGVGLGAGGPGYAFSPLSSAYPPAPPEDDYTD